MLQIEAPKTGLFSLDLYSTGGNIVLHIIISARIYNWLSERNVLVLNTFQEGSLESEMRPTGFIFQPGIGMTLDVVVKSGGVDVLQDNRLFASFPYTYRSDLPVNSVRRIRVVSVNNQSAQNELFTIR